MTDRAIVGTESHEFVGDGERCAGILGYALGHPRHGEVCGYWRAMPIHDCPRKVRPGRITDEMVEAFGSAVTRAADAAGSELSITDSVIRAGLVAALTRRELERRTEPELHPINLDPYPATVQEVADEIVRFVMELDDSGVARNLADLVLSKLRSAMDA